MISMDPMISLSVNIGVNVLSYILREIVAILLNVIHAMPSDYAVHLLVTVDLIGYCAEETAAVIHHVLDYVPYEVSKSYRITCISASRNSVIQFISVGDQFKIGLPFFRIVFSKRRSFSSHSCSVNWMPRCEYSSSEL